MSSPCHLLVEGNPAIVYASRKGEPESIQPVLLPFLEKFWQERETAGEYLDTPECLLAQLIVRFGFEFCEDDFSNLRVGLQYKPKVEYLYWISLNKTVNIWVPEAKYFENPAVGLQGCRQLEGQSWSID
ncbi:histidine kinase [Geitlerinema sp. PCC 9228]|jgi:hypothetical protein|uniref:histidine kinase n=1 Tax=Geitlerinema sp. PCC 9228 TaxID=111611 RepID=UPI0008F9A374|nr:histidine kinase [Geitlerinema sp. PCC 9228]